jgi:glycosyltransferase
MLFVAGGSPATVFALAPLASAARGSGHAVLMASTEDMMPTVAAAGLPAIAATDLPISHFIATDRDGNPVQRPPAGLAQAMHTGAWFARMAVASMAVLRQVAVDWRPDIVVGGTMAYAAGLLARELDLPYVRHAWDAIESTDMDRGAERELRAELAALRLTGLPEPDLFVDVCPPSLRPPGAASAQSMRWAPGNAQRRLERWMYTKGERPRVLVTSGSRVAVGSSHRDHREAYSFLFELISVLAPLEVELLAATAEEVGVDVRAQWPAVRAGWIPLDVVAPTCNVIVHHGGGVTSLTALRAGVAQVLIPQGTVLVPAARRIAEFGAGLTVLPDEDVAVALPSAVRKVLADPQYTERAQLMSREIATLPRPADVVDVLAKLVENR